MKFTSGSNLIINFDLITFIFVLLSCFYFLILLLMFTGLSRLKNHSSEKNYSVSIIVAARNEEKQIRPCLESLELLNYPKEFSKKQNILYKFTVYTPQEEMKQIILEDPDARVNTLRHVFGIDKYKRILENISLLLSKIREEKRRERTTRN